MGATSLMRLSWTLLTTHRSFHFKIAPGPLWEARDANPDGRFGRRRKNYDSYVSSRVTVVHYLYHEGYLTRDSLQT